MYCNSFDIDVLSAKCRVQGFTACLRQRVSVFLFTERAIPFDQLMFEHLHKWGQRRQEVKFYLRHEESLIANFSQGA